MPEDRIIVNADFTRKMTSFVGNPFVGIAIGLVISIFFYIISISQKKPYYYYSSPKMIAQQQFEKMKLTVVGKSVSNIYSVDLILWNNGGEFIDHSDFMDSKPTVLKCTEPIHFLACDIIKKSRAELKFLTKASFDSVSIKMIGDDAFEQGDGIFIRAFYTTLDTMPKTFNLSSRIKGTANGFEYVDLPRMNRKKHTNPLLIGWGIIIGLVFIRSFTLLIFKRPIVFRKSEIIALTISLIIWTYYTYEYFYFAIYLRWM